MTQALPSILQKIIQDKTTWIAEKQAQLPLASFQDQLERSDRDFYQAMQQGSKQRPSYILECKKPLPQKA